MNQPQRADLVAAATIAKWRKHPDLFVIEELKANPDAWQIDVLRAIPNNMRIAMKACKGPGKTALLAWVAWWFLSVFPHPKIAATSITGDNLKDGLWAEMSKWQQKSDYLKHYFTWTATRIYCNLSPETWFMSARQWAKSATPEAQADTLAGLHADFILFILDEVGAIPDAVMAAAEAALANAGTEVNPDAKAWIVMAGNPTQLSGPLYRACTTEARLWHVTEITGDPDSPKRSPRISITWARQQIEKYGRDNPWVMVNVFGKFPPASINALLGPDDISAAVARLYTKAELVDFATILGADIAAMGDDKTVIYPRTGPQVFTPTVMMQQTGIFIANQIARIYRELEADTVFVDDTGGWGRSTVENLQLKPDIVTIPIGFSGKAPEIRFLNMRSYMAWKLAEAIKSGGMAIPDIPELREELCAMEYTFKGDKLALIEKEQIKDKIGRSPDHSDALMLTEAFPVVKTPAHLRQKQAGEYNPVEDYVQSERSKHADYDPFHEFRKK